jgi:protein phosphatase
VRFAWGAATDVGRVRTNNQDSYLADDDVWAVADGMGGHRGGEVASHIAIDVLSSSFEHASLDGLREAARIANEAVFQQASDDPELRGMGTTLVAIAPVDDEEGETALGWVNIGDSRLYRVRDGELEQISEDHSLVEEMVRDGRISPDEARTHPQRNILTRALGIDEHAVLDTGTIDAYTGDRFLLCSDGLFNEVDEGRIAATLRRLADPGEGAQELVRLALEGGGRDNVPVIVVDVVDDDEAAANASAAVAGGTAEGHADDVDSAAHADDKAEARRTRAEARAARKAERPRRLTLRVLLFAVVLVAVLGGTAFAVYRVARGGYTVKSRGSEVVIYRGSGDQVLWLKPSIEQNLGAITVQPRYQQAVKDGQHFNSLSAARAYAADLATNAGATTTTTTTTTSTSTTSTSTSTTTTTAVAPP